MMRYSERSKNKWKKEEVWTVTGQTEDNFVALWPGHQAGAVIFKHVTHETVRY